MERRCNRRFYSTELLISGLLVEIHQLPLAIAGQAGAAIEFGNAVIGMAAGDEHPADHAIAAILGNRVDHTGASRCGIGPGTGLGPSFSRSAEETALRTVSWSDRFSGSFGMVPVEIDRSTLGASPPKSMTPPTQPPNMRQSAAMAIKRPLVAQRPFLHRSGFAMSLKTCPVLHASLAARAYAEHLT